MRTEKEIIEIYLRINAACVLSVGQPLDDVLISMHTFKDALSWTLGVEDKPTELLLNRINELWDIFPEKYKEHLRKLGHIRLEP